VRLSFAVGYRQGDSNAFRLEIRLWGIRIFSIPSRRSRRSGWIGRKLSRWIESFLSSKPAETAETVEKPTKPRKKSRSGFVIWVAGRAMNLASRLTRRFEVGCGGIDPALLGSLTGVAAIVQGALGTKRFGWHPDFAPGAVRIEVKWTLSISIWKLVAWTGETFTDRNRQPRKASGFVVSSP